MKAVIKYPSGKSEKASLSTQIREAGMERGSVILVDTENPARLSHLIQKYEGEIIGIVQETTDLITPYYQPLAGIELLKRMLSVFSKIAETGDLSKLEESDFKIVEEVEAVCQ